MKIVAFGKHLCADKNIEGATGKGAQRFLELALRTRGIAIEAGNSRTRKFLAQPFFQVLGTFSKKIDIFRMALWALFGNLLNRAAVMTFEPVAAFVVRHRNAAIHALHRSAAAPADHGPGIAAAINEDESLRAVAKTCLGACLKGRRNRARLVGLMKLFAQADDFDRR